MSSIFFSGNASSEPRMIVLGEVPPSQPEQEQESAQDVAAQWLQSEDQKTLATGSNVSATASCRRQDVPPVPQPRQRIAKERSNIRVLPSNRNRKSRCRRITVAGNHLIHLIISGYEQYLLIKVIDSNRNV